MPVVFHDLQGVVVTCLDHLLAERLVEDVDVAGLHRRKARGRIGQEADHDLVEMLGLRIVVVRILLEGDAVVLFPLRHHVGTGADRTAVEVGAGAVLVLDGHGPEQEAVGREEGREWRPGIAQVEFHRGVVDRDSLLQRAERGGERLVLRRIEDALEVMRHVARGKGRPVGEFHSRPQLQPPGQAVGRSVQRGGEVRDALALVRPA